MPKAQRTRGLSSGYQIKFFKSYHKFSNKSLSDFIFIFSTKQQLQNFNQISALRLNINFKILTKRIFWVWTKNNLHNLNQGSAAKFWLNFHFKNSPEVQLQNLYQTLCSKSEVESSAIFRSRSSYFAADPWLRLWKLFLVEILKLRLIKILKFKFSQNANIWLSFWSCCFVENMKIW